ncbi:malto-oligosyltrehalose trehalohydrolase [Lysobacter sp. D1-1-M9]|uniref:malto-oligosyltrehalose trehalohydrolase n=2 Tax=Novilysobacter TaxID=3382699 RepID=UPI002FC97D61
MSRFVHELPFGAQWAAAQARFRVWAPSCGRLSVRIDDGDAIPLSEAGDGWFEARIDCAAGARYRYVLEDGSAVADPAARAQDGGVDAASLVVDPAHYSWQHADWRGRPWAEAVIYELHVGAFGGFAGVQARLQELAALGVTAIELMPIAQFPGERNWGYDGVLPFAPAACYGTPDELKALVDAAHGHGLMVLLDVVYNHFGPDGNVMPRLAAPFFRDDVDTPWGPAIDFRRPQVRDFFAQNALYWLMEYRFDGLRLDAVHAITERDWLPELAAKIRATVEPGRHVHLVLENEHNDAGLLQQGFDAQWNDDAHHVLHVLLTGERDAYYADYADDPTAGLAHWLGEGFVYQGQPCAYRDDAPRGQPSAHLPTSAFVNCLQNHDQIGNRALGERLSTLADPAALRAATALLLLTPQIPMLFMGEEWNSRQPFLYFTDHHGELAEAVREGRRREFTRFPAFRDPARREAIPDPNAPRTFASSIPDFEQSRSDEDSAHRAFVQHLLRLRREEIVPRLPGTRSIGVDVLAQGAVHARWRMGDGSVLSVLVNLGAGSISHAPPGTGRVLYETTAGATDDARRGELAAHTVVAWLAPDGTAEVTP